MIGKKIWIMDQNHRVYRKDEKGRSIGGPIWREYWGEVEITGETKLSWLTSWGQKIPKKGGYGIAFTEEEVNRLAYVEENKYRISDAVRNLEYDKLKQVAEIIGYKESV